MGQVKVNVPNITEAFRNFFDGATIDDSAPAQGKDCKPKKEEMRGFFKAPCEVHLHNADSHIVLGRDRPGPTGATEALKQGGYGPIGSDGAHMIDMVVGRHSAFALGSGKVPPCAEGTPDCAGPDFEHDAARIYISQKCDLDDYFDLDVPTPEKTRQFSGIGMMADAVRICSRGGIKLVTGMHKKNSTGAVNAFTGQGVHLIGGNNTASPDNIIQPMVLGDKLVETLDALVGAVAANSSMIAQINMHLVPLIGAFAVHQHAGPLSPPVDPTAAVQFLIQTTQELANKIPASMVNFATYKAKNFVPFGDSFILSRWHFLN